MSARRITVGEVLVVGLAVVAGSSLAGALRGPGLWVAAILGALVAFGAARAAQHLRLLTLEWLALALAGMAILGGVAVGWVPTPGAYATFVRGLVSSWAEILTSTPPTDAVDVFRVPPFVLAVLAGTIGLIVLERVRIPVLPAIGPALVFAFGLLFSIESRTTALVQGACLICLSLWLGWWQQRTTGVVSDESIGNTTVARRRGRVLYAAALMAAVSVLAPVIAPSLAALHGRERFDLRDELEPPWNPLDEPSPLAQIKSNYKDEIRDEVVFVARGDVPRRWALATLANYNGQVWTVGDSAAGGAAEFVPVDRATPSDPTDPDRAQRPESVEVEMVANVAWPWLPVPGRVHQIRQVEGHALDLRFNARTGTMADPRGAAGAAYSLEFTRFPIVPDAAELTIVPAADAGLDQIAANMSARSADFVEGAKRGWPQVQALRSALRNGTYLATDHTHARPGHSLGRLDSFLANDTLIGNEEQYAAMAAIAARVSGFPARVVVGWLADEEKELSGPVEFTRNEATAWVEVLSEEFGWVPVDVTPDRTETPDLDSAGTNYTDVAAPNPPVPPPPPPEQETDQDVDEDAEEDEDEPSQAGVPTWVIAASTAAAIPLVLLSLWLLAMAGLKRRRRQLRRNQATPGRQVAGAWFEAKDRLVEAGLDPQGDLSVREYSMIVDLRFDGSSGLPQLADVVDEAAFGPRGATIEAAEHAWRRCEALTSALSGAARPSERFRRIADPTTLLRRDPATMRIGAREEQH